MEAHIEKMRAREQSEKDTIKQDRVTQVLNLLIEHALTTSAMPIPKQYSDYHANEWLQAWDYLNQYVIDRVYHKLQQYHQAVQSTLDVINQPIYDRKFGQLGNCLARFQQLAEAFRDTHNLMVTHRVYCDLHNIYNTDILPLIMSIFNSAVDALPSAEIYISKMDTMKIMDPENLNLPIDDNLFLLEQPKLKPMQPIETPQLSDKGKEEATVSFHELFDALLLSQILAQDDEAGAILAELRNDNNTSPEASEDDEDLAMAIALSQNMAQASAPPTPPDNAQEQEVLDIAAALSADDQHHNITVQVPEDEQVSIAMALSMPSPTPTLQRAPTESRFRLFFNRLTNRTAPPPPMLPPAEDSSSEDEVVKNFRNEFW